MRRRAALAAAVLLLLGAPRQVHGQRPPSGDPLASAIQAYRDLEYDSAATRLRAALARPRPDTLSDADRLRALVYLGATEVYRERRDAGLAAFRQLVLADPRYRPDQLIFPPEIVGVFEQVRLGTKAVAAVAPPLTQIAGGERLVVRLFATSYHEIAANVVRPTGAVVRRLYGGAIGDSLEVLWDGRDATGTPADSGRYLFRVTSRGANGRTTRTLDLPLEVGLAREDTLPHPLRPIGEPAGATGGRPRSARALVLGAVGAVAAVALPSLVAGDVDASGARYGVAIAIGAAGVAGFVTQRQSAPPDADVAATARRREWERAVADVVAENERRRREVRIVVRVGAPVVTEAR